RQAAPTSLHSGAMGRLILLGVVVALLAAGCGGKTSYSAAKTRECQTKEDAQVGGKLDFVATTATGGAFVARLAGKWVTISVGAKEEDAKGIQIAYQRFALDNVRQNITDVLSRYKNAVLLWHAHPSSEDLGVVIGCLD